MSPQDRTRQFRVALLFVLFVIGPLLGTPTWAVAEPADQEDIAEFDDLMEGFDDDPEFDLDLDEESLNPPSWLGSSAYGRWIEQNVDLSGSLGVGSSFSYLDHKVPHGDDPSRSTSYGNLTRLDLKGFLQLDIQLPLRWKIRAELLGWYDFVYRIKGRGSYGGEVLDVYEWQIDSGEAYLSGPLTSHVDLTIGRKIVNWGRSDTFRVVDVINPLDNKEPGLVDIKDLRRAKAMVKLDATAGAWSLQLLVIPEHRFDRNPPRGSDFFPPTSPTLPSPAIKEQRDFSGMPGLAGKIDGRFSGWDFSVYGAYVDESSRVIDLDGPTGPRQEQNRFGMLGAAGNLTRGAWLVKIEVAWLTELRVIRFRPATASLSSDDRDRIDSMVGIEYYGPDQLTVALEIVSRQLLNEPTDSNNPLTPQRTQQSQFETGLRISRPFFRERLNLTLLALGFGERFQHGGLLRFSGDYDLTDSWNLEGGILIFLGGPDQGLGAFESNDRLFAKIQYFF